MHVLLWGLALLTFLPDLLIVDASTTGRRLNPIAGKSFYCKCTGYFSLIIFGRFYVLQFTVGYTVTGC